MPTAEDLWATGLGTDANFPRRFSAIYVAPSLPPIRLPEPRLQLTQAVKPRYVSSKPHEMMANSRVHGRFGK
jgi:hypothetical protein